MSHLLRLVAQRSGRWLKCHRDPAVKEVPSE
jgi:hypothetical protein